VSSDVTTVVTRQEDIPAFREGLYSDHPFGLLGSRCGHCEHIGFPVRAFCPKCRREDALDVVSLPTVGIVHTFTIVRQAPKGVNVPYVLARIALSDSIRVMAQVRTSSVDAVNIGSTVTLISALFPTASGAPAGGYAFQLLTEEESK
jgi:uncharacterized OB-fold protein